MSVLALSDAAHKSEGALQCAGRIAGRFRMPLHVVHAMELTHRSLRAVFPVLNNLGEEMKAADAVVNEQVVRLVPPSVVVTSVVSMLDPLRAIERRAAEVSPFITVTPAGLGWSSRERGALTAARCLRLKSPVCIVRGAPRERGGTCLVISHAQVFRQEILSSAARWYADLMEQNEDGTVAPTPDVLLVADHADVGQVLSRIERYDADMIVLHLQMFSVPHLVERLNAITAAMMSRTQTTILLLPDTAQIHETWRTQ